MPDLLDDLPADAASLFARARQFRAEADRSALHAAEHRARLEDLEKEPFASPHDPAFVTLREAAERLEREARDRHDRADGMHAAGEAARTPFERAKPGLKIAAFVAIGAVEVATVVATGWDIAEIRKTRHPAARYGSSRA